MSTTKAIDLVGPGADPEQAVRFLHGWFGEDAPGLVMLFSLPARLPLALPVAVLVEQITRRGLNGVIWPGSDDTRPRDRRHEPDESAWPQDVYTSVGLLREAPPPRRRGGRDLVFGAPGAWADWDLREGSFASWEEIWFYVEHLDSLGVGPGLVVASGSGGAHVYWPVGGGRRLWPGEAEDASRRVRLLLQHLTGHRLDRVEDCARQLRLPGSLHTRAGARVELVRCEPARMLNLGRLAELTDALVEAEDARREQRYASAGPGSLRGADSPWLRDLCRAEVGGALQRLREAPPGSRTARLYAVSAQIGEWIGTGLVRREQALEHLLRAAEANGATGRYGAAEVRRQALNGLRAGESRVAQ